MDYITNHLEEYSLAILSSSSSFQNFYSSVLNISYHNLTTARLINLKLSLSYLSSLSSPSLSKSPFLSYNHNTSKICYEILTHLPKINLLHHKATTSNQQQQCIPYIFRPSPLYQFFVCKRKPEFLTRVISSYKKIGSNRWQHQDCSAITEITKLLLTSYKVNCHLKEEKIIMTHFRACLSPHK